MPIRDFYDDTGVPWRVWDVRPARPSLLERRNSERRRQHAPVSFDERRLRIDRRVNPGAALAQGWLVFRSDSERRRLFGDALALEEASSEDLQSWLAEARSAPAHLHALESIESE